MIACDTDPPDISYAAAMLAPSPPPPVTLQPLLLQPSTSPLHTPAPQPALLAAAPPGGVVRPGSAPPPPVAVPTFLETVPPPSPLQVRRHLAILDYHVVV